MAAGVVRDYGKRHEPSTDSCRWTYVAAAGAV
jgi:hypothetical protein